MKITRFEDIESWKAARQLVGQVYQATRSGKIARDHDLVRQMKRAATSAMSNIAEGFESGSDFEFRRFLRMSRRSMSEFQSHSYVALMSRERRFTRARK